MYAVQVFYPEGINHLVGTYYILFFNLFVIKTTCYMHHTFRSLNPILVGFVNKNMLRSVNIIATVKLIPN